MAELDGNLTFVQGPSLFIAIAQALNPLGLQFDRSLPRSRNSTRRNAVRLSQFFAYEHFTFTHVPAWLLASDAPLPPPPPPLAPVVLSRWPASEAADELRSERADER